MCWIAAVDGSASGKAELNRGNSVINEPSTKVNKQLGDTTPPNAGQGRQIDGHGRAHRRRQVGQIPWSFFVRSFGLPKHRAPGACSPGTRSGRCGKRTAGLALNRTRPAIGQRTCSPGTKRGVWPSISPSCPIYSPTRFGPPRLGLGIGTRPTQWWNYSRSRQLLLPGSKCADLGSLWLQSNAKPFRPPPRATWRGNYEMDEPVPLDSPCGCYAWRHDAGVGTGVVRQYQRCAAKCRF